MTRSRGLILGLFGILIVALVNALAYRTPGPRSAAAADTFSAFRAQAQLNSLVGDGIAHPISSEANAHVREILIKRLSALGYDAEIQSGFVCSPLAVCGTPRNIVARRRTSSDEEAADKELVLLSAHYDSVSAGPGASDDGAGVATVLEIARILAAKRSMHHGVVILITDGEEAGLLGALLFVRDHPLAKRIAADVNLEARGVSGPSLMFETGGANAWLMGLYRRSIARPITDSVYYVAYKTMPNNTDFSVFKGAGWQGFNFAYIGDVGRYHTALDTFENVNLRSIQHQGDNALGGLLALANSAGSLSQPAADAVYFDVLSRALVSWPARFSLAITSGVLALLLIEAGMLWHARRVMFRQIAWGALGALACAVLAATTGAAILLLLLKSGKVPPLAQYSWIAHPAWMNMTCAALAAAAAGILSHRWGRRAGFWGFWFGTMLLVAVLDELLAALRPGLGFFFLITTAVGAMAVIPALLKTRTWLEDIAALVPAWTVFALIMPVVSLLYGALGSVAWVIDSLLLSLGATLLLPLLAVAEASTRRLIITASGIAGGLGVIVTLALPTYSDAWPQRLDFRYRLDATRHQAVWIAEPDSLRLPTYLKSAAPFDAELRPEYEGGRLAFEARAPWFDLAPPILELRSAQAQSGGLTRFNLHLQSLRGAPEIEALFPVEAQIHSVILNDASGERRVPLYELPNDMTRLRVVGLQPQGIDLAIEARGPLEVHLFDQSHELRGGEFLTRVRPPEATSSQEGDTTIVQTSVTLDPAAGR